MTEELLINVTPQETRVATVENGMLTEIWIERAQKIGRVGTIFQGTVKRVLPGMEAAFVDIGLEKAAFLHVSDVQAANANQAEPSIARLLHEGQTLAVQVTKDPLGTKGARVTSKLTVPSRYLVMMPYEDNIGVSVRIDNEAERERLRSNIELLRGESKSNGYIVRTAAEGAETEALQADMEYLAKAWKGVQERRKSSKPGAVIFRDLPLVQRMMRDLNRGNIERIRIDSRETYAQCVTFCNEYVPELETCLEHYPGERPIFDLHGVEDEIDKALNKRVSLKSGGHLVIDQTESMTTIDVNTGGFVGKHNLEETIFKTNLEAAQAIARQLRLRNLGGIIIIDFIDMTILEHRRQVLRALEKALERDHARTQVNEVSPLGLVEMTRKRTRESLEQVLCSECSVCDGRGMQKTLETVGFEIAREIIRQVRQFDIVSVTVLASSEIVEWFTEERSDDLAELQDFAGVPIRLQAEQYYTREHYDVVLQ
ncbi:ribonuclease G [Granulosicoccus antarcticus]|uniref:Ribonuclease G n=1 Tax=Granulosicoccus antarcticus IMCC3135 TaxID=1192854 RepID=A0A2Z2P066_9GAMM|nr:ribonuclease G [Granulosicoccus antarcticus]ASJ76125.1 Ribonuclease G [Granulosicoccus antarcticus IMCC3135]